MLKQLPNLFTLLNLFFGCIAIVYILQSNQYFVVYEYTQPEQVNLPIQWCYGSLFIGLAAVVDFFDGFVARLLNATSDMGKQLDSLADCVSFGVAPSLIMYQLLRYGYMQQPNGITTPLLLLTPAFIVACAAAYRLATFNLSTTQTTYFEGVPTPAVGLVIASLPLILYYTSSNIVATVVISPYLVYALIATLSWLMVCKYRMLSLKLKKEAFTLKNPLLYIALSTIITAILMGWWCVPICFVSYIGASLFTQKNIK